MLIYISDENKTKHKTFVKGSAGAHYKTCLCAQFQGLKLSKAAWTLAPEGILGFILNQPEDILT